MNKKSVYEVAIKLLALFFLIKAIEVIPSLGMALATYNSDHVSNPYLYVGSPASLFVIYLFCAAIFLKKTKLIVGMLCGESQFSDNQEAPKYEGEKLLLWIQVIGLYYFVMSLGSLVSHLSQLGSTNYSWWTPIITKAVILIISLYFIFRTSSVGKIIEKYSK